jgi:flagellar biosynthesis component FlhA
MEVGVAKEAVRQILVRALAPHVIEALDAIDALTVTVSDEELLEESRENEEQRREKERIEKQKREAAEDALETQLHQQQTVLYYSPLCAANISIFLSPSSFFIFLNL